MVQFIRRPDALGKPIGRRSSLVFEGEALAIVPGSGD